MKRTADIAAARTPAGQQTERALAVAEQSLRKQETISIIDTTLRDGLQHEEHYIPLDQRLELLELLTDAGVTKLEVGSFASQYT